MCLNMQYEGATSHVRARDRALTQDILLSHSATACMQLE